MLSFPHKLNSESFSSDYDQRRAIAQTEQGRRDTSNLITVNIRGVMIPTLDLDPDSDFKLFGDSGFGTSEKQNHNTYRGVLTLALDPDSESDFQPFGDFGFRSTMMWNCTTSSEYCLSIIQRERCLVGAVCVFLAKIDGEGKEAGQQPLRQERHSQSVQSRGWVSG